MTDDVSMTWFRLRERRSSLRSRSRLDDSAARRQTFAAAMQQFEEQFAAAKVVTAYTRPLNLYYGLAQAGMAIAAAHAPDPWSFSRHGLALTDRSGELAAVTVKPEGEGGFQKIAATTGSPAISGPVSLGALWASLPSLQVGMLPGPGFPACLGLASDESNGGPPQATVFFDADMPEGEDEAWMKRFGEMMAACPTAAGWAIPMRQGSIVKPQEAGQRWMVTVGWPYESPTVEMSSQDLKTFFDKMAPEYMYRSDRYLRPGVGADRGVAPSPLMTWWLLLYSFSILARYEPRRWAQLLDLDSSRAAVLIEYALNEALAMIPHLVLEALDQSPLLLAKPLAL
jgi:hypothetical protein